MIRDLYWFISGTLITGVLQAGAICAFAYGLVPQTPLGFAVLIFDYLLMLPGLPALLLFSELQLIPTGEDDDLVRGIFTACVSSICWGIMSVAASGIYQAATRHYVDSRS